MLDYDAGFVRNRVTKAYPFALVHAVETGLKATLMNRDLHHTSTSGIAQREAIDPSWETKVARFSRFQPPLLNTTDLLITRLARPIDDTRDLHLEMLIAKRLALVQGQQGAQEEYSRLAPLIGSSLATLVLEISSIMPMAILI